LDSGGNANGGSADSNVAQKGIGERLINFLMNDDDDDE